MNKTLSFACVHFTVAFALTWLITGSVAAGGVVALVEPLCNTLAFHVHEKVWQRRAGAASPAAALAGPAACAAG
ncbi:MAG: DUF2061 domain-containing protein [Gammaproteobacteria bacterium]